MNSATMVNLWDVIIVKFNQDINVFPKLDQNPYALCVEILLFSIDKLVIMEERKVA